MMPPPTDVSSPPVGGTNMPWENKAELPAVSYRKPQPPAGSFTGAQPLTVPFTGAQPLTGPFTVAQTPAGSFTVAQPTIGSFSGTQLLTGSFMGNLPPAGSFIGVQRPTGFFTRVQPPAGSLTETQPDAGSFTAVQPDAGSFTGAQPPVGSSSGVQPPISSFIGVKPSTGSFTGAHLPADTFTGHQLPVISFTGVQPTTGSFPGTQQPTGSFPGAQPPTGSFTGPQLPVASFTGDQPPVISFAGAQPPTGSFPRTQPPTGSFIAAQPPTGFFAGAQPPTCSFRGAQPPTGSFKGAQPPTGFFTGAQPPTGSFPGPQPPTGSFPGPQPPTGSFTGAQPPAGSFTRAQQSTNSITSSEHDRPSLTVHGPHRCKQIPDFTHFVNSSAVDHIHDVKVRLKESLRRTLKDSLKHDWLEEGLNYPLMKYYKDLVWVRMVKEVMGKKKKPMKGIDELLEVPGAGKKGLNILVEARAGMGKTCSMAKFAMVYAEDKEKFPFDFVFFIPLSNIVEDCSLAEVIIAEHDQLEKEDVELVQSILKGKTKHKVLLLLDGYDEYTRGTNKDIDRAIEKTFGKCLIILSSRPVDEKYFNQNIRNKMLSEVVIEGFSTENIKNCCLMYLNTEEECEQFFEEVKKHSTKSLKGEYKGLYELLKVPIMLLILCVMYKESEDKSLPQRRTQTYEEFYELVMDRTTLKPHNFGCESRKVPNIKSRLQILGQFAWEALKSNKQPLLLNDKELEKKCPDIKKLGLLSVINKNFGASKYICHRLETAGDMKVTLKELFPSWRAVKRFSEVILFTVGLMKNPISLIDYVYAMYIEQCLNSWESDTQDEEQFFKLIYMESTIPLPGQPLHNQHINCYKQQRSHEIEPVYRPSKLYMFSLMKEGVLCNVTEELHTAEAPECTIIINEPCSSAVTESLLVTCQKLCQHQSVANLFLKGLTCEDLLETDLFRFSKNTQTIKVNSCKLTVGIMSHLMQQCYNCKYLTKLDLSGTSLFEGGYHLAQGITSCTEPPQFLELVLHNCSITGDVSDKLLQFVSSCKHLTYLSVANNSLSGFLSSFLPDPQAGPSKLEILNLDATALKEEDLQHLLNLFKSNNLPKLQYVDLSNNILEGFLANLLVSIHLQFPELEKLSLQHTALSKRDLQVLFSNTHKLPKLRYLDLSHNMLTGCLSEFPPQAELYSLEKLDFEDTALNNEDMQHLTYLIRNQKLPHLTWLNLDKNDLCEVKKELKQLIKICVAHHHRELKIQLKLNNLPESFLEKYQRRSDGTYVCLSI